MKRIPFASYLLAAAAIVCGVTARPAQAQTTLRIVGALSNFDCYNDTSGDCEGFEIEIEGIHKEQVAHTWAGSAFGAPTVTDGTNPAGPSAVIRYHSNTVVLHKGAVTHFGVTLTYYTQSGTVLRRWLPATTISVPNPPPVPYILPAHQSVITAVNGVEAVHNSITNDTPDGTTILWVLPYGNKVRGRGVSLEELMPNNAIVTNAVPMGSGSNHLTPSRLDPGMTWTSDDPPTADEMDSGVLWYEVYKDVATSGGKGKVTHTPGALVGRVMDATITNLNTPVPSAFDLSDTAVFGTQDVIGRVTIQGFTPGGSTPVTLTSDNPVATVPATVSVSQNATAVVFTIHTTAVSVPTLVNLTATTGGGIRSASFTVNPPALTQLYLALQQVGGGNPVSGTVFLTTPAPTGGIAVALSSNSVLASVPASVTVPAGSTSVGFTIGTSPVTAPNTVLFSGVYNGVTQTATLRIVPNVVTVSGLLTLEGLAATAPDQTITFTFRPTGGGTSFDRTAAIGANRAFSFGDVPPGIYTMHVKGAKYLAVNVPINAPNNSVNGLSVLLPAGDANGDNVVDIGDFGLLVNAYGTDSATAGSGYDASADFNGDGVIDIADFGLLVNNYGNQGAL